MANEKSSSRSIGHTLNSWVQEISLLVSSVSSMRVLITIVLLGMAYRFTRIDYHSLWFDELHSILASAPENTLGYIIGYARTDQPPLSFLYLNFVFQIFPYNAMTGRLACAVLGLISIMVMYRLGKEFGDGRTGLVAAFLTSINYFHIFYSTELRFYSATFLFTALSYLFFVRAIKTSEKRMFVFYFLSTSALLYTHYYSVFVFASQCVTFFVILYYRQWDRRLLIQGLISGIAVAVSYIPWLPTLMSDFSYSGQFWIKKPEPLFVADYFYSYTGKDIVTTLIFVVLIVLAVRMYVRSWKQFSQQSVLAWILLIWIVLGYLLPYIRSVTHLPILHPRYTIIILPAWLVVVAIGWSQIKNTNWKFTTLLVIILSGAVNLISVRKFYTGIRNPQFREASQYILSHNDKNLPVYSTLPWQFSFFFRDAPGAPLALTDKEFYGVYQFWLLIPEFEMERVVQELNPEFEIVDRRRYYGAEAALLRRRYGGE